MALYDVNGDILNIKNSVQTSDVLVASSETSDDIKESADYVCTGTNDETVIQQAINFIASKGGGKVRLSNGTFYIGSFSQSDTGGYSALILPQTSGYNYNIEILGASLQFGWTKSSTYSEGTKIEITESCYESLSSGTAYTIIRSGYVASLMNTPSHVSMILRDMLFLIPSNQKKITCIDNLYTNRVLIERVQFRAYKPNYDGYTSGTPQVATEGCIAMRSMGGSNSGCLADYRNMSAFGFYEGFKLGSEHIIGLNLSAIYCVYGYTFGNYHWANVMAHPITLINCCDERNVNLPLFVDNGFAQSNGYTNASSTTGYQAITMIDFNIERGDTSATPGGVIGDLATESTPGKFRGSIEYTMTYGSGSGYNSNNTTQYFWASGSGEGFVSRNQAQTLGGTSATRRTYAPNYLQQYYDTTAGKMLWCVDPANKTWKDADGNTVS